MSFGKTTFGRNHIVDEVQFAAIAIVYLARFVVAIVHTRLKGDLETSAQIIGRTIVENRSDRIPVSSSVFPHIYAAIGHHRSRMIITAEPMHGIYLVAHPLTG